MTIWVGAQVSRRSVKAVTGLRQNKGMSVPVVSILVGISNSASYLIAFRQTRRQGFCFIIYVDT